MATAASPAGPDVETLTTAFRQVHSPYESGSSYTKTTYISGEARGRTLMLNSEEKAENVINCISCNCLIFERLNPSDAIIVNICLKSLLAHSAAVKDDCPLESLCPDFEAKIRVLRKSAELPLRGGPDQPGRDGVFSYKAAS
ncbi:hypothetical protein ACHWQZ_G012897 [Mnemiopsis leidyi]